MQVNMLEDFRGWVSDTEKIAQVDKDTQIKLLK